METILNLMENQKNNYANIEFESEYRYDGNIVPRVTKNAKHAEGFVEITPIKLSHRVHIEAYCCENCRLVQFEY